MPQSVFHFKRFTIHQDRCAMKVGTDGVLLGAWVQAGEAKRVLDIGTGTGLIALMMAQKSTASVDAIDIDSAACEQARQNARNVLWADRIRVTHASLQDFKPGYRYDLIVSNPPYFIDSFEASGEARNMARSASHSLSYDELLQGVVRLLHITGRFCVILPFKEGRIFRDKAEQNGLFCNHLVNVKTGRDKPWKRVLMEFSRQEEELVEEELVIHYDERQFTEAYKALTRDFYPAF